MNQIPHLVLFLSLFFWATASASAQTVSSAINYQGYLTDVAGAPLHTGAEPTNVELEFRVWDESQGGTLIWAEKQTVSVFNGNFNTLLGNGSEIGDEPRGALDGAFAPDSQTSNLRYMEVTMGDRTFLPRQRIVANPFAFRAKVAETVMEGAIGSVQIADGSITSADITDGSIESRDIKDNTITGTDIASSSIESSQIKDFTIQSQDVRRGGLAGWTIANETITSANIANGTITGNDISTSLAFLRKNPTQPERTAINAAPQNAALYVDGRAHSLVAVFARGIIASTESMEARSGFRTTSDERIKTIKGRSDSAADLDSLLDIEITDYVLKDLGPGAQPAKKVIAQQVEKVFPMAVSYHTNAVPDIYTMATIEAGWVNISQSLKAGERVRLTHDGSVGFHEVLEAEPNRFRVDLEGSGEIFAYGREVDDFRSVDYDAISMLNVSATQELHKKVQVLEAQNEDLQKRLAALEALAKQLVQAGQPKPAARPAPVNAARITLPR